MASRIRLLFLLAATMLAALFGACGRGESWYG